MSDTGYIDCACRDCFEVAIGKPGDMCSECQEAGCDANGEHECCRDDAYGCNEFDSIEEEEREP